MKLKTDYKIRKIAGESVIVRMGAQNVKMTSIISFNATSEWLWEQLQDEEFDVEKVADLLTAEYEVEREVALVDANKWVEMLRNAELVNE
ncbi:MAG: PqqD family protein [Tidjanibacter sp.]|nr:PqqD family protein [Tidjanibacter sp.]